MPAEETRRHSAGGVLGAAVLPLCAVGLVVGVWALLARVSLLPPFILPSPWRVGAQLWGDRALLLGAGGATLWVSAVGLTVAVGLAMLSAMVMDLFPLVRRMWYPLVVLSQTIQILAVAPLIIIWFGFGAQSTLAIVVLFCFFPVNIALIHGLQGTPAEYVRQFRAMRATRWQVWSYCRLPAALPSLFGGVRIAAAYAVISATIGEWVGGTGGLGVYILRSKNALQTARVFGGMVVCSALSVGLFFVVKAVERAVLARYPRGDAMEDSAWRGTPAKRGVLARREAMSEARHTPAKRGVPKRALTKEKILKEDV